MVVLLKRTLSSVVLIALLTIGVLNQMVFAFLMMLFTVLGLYEFFSMLEKKGISIYKYFGIGMGAVIPLSILFKFELTKKWELLFIVLALLFLTIMQLKRRENQGVVIGISTTIFGILYVSWFLSFLIKIRFLPGGIGFLTSILVMTKAGDIGAYLVGSRFGKTPLLPRVSPNKSVEGSIAGLLFSSLGGLACRSLLGFSYGHVLLLGCFIGILAQLGDLSESLMKRDCEVKDSGQLVPGMGGVLDLMDSLLFTAPVFYFYISIVLKYIDIY